MVKNLSATWETWVQSLVWEDTLDKEMEMDFSILAWRIPWGLKEQDKTEWLTHTTHTHTHTHKMSILEEKKKAWQCHSPSLPIDTGRSCVFLPNNLENSCKWITFPWEANNLFELHQICVAGQQCCTLQSCRMSWSSSHWLCPSGEWLALHHRFPCQTQFLFDTFIWPSHNFFSPGFKTGIKYIFF